MKRRHVLLRIVGAALVPVGILLATAAGVFATDPPTSTPTISDVKANVNLIDSGDVLIYGLYNIPYGVEDLPPDDASKTYLIRLMGTDGTTQIGVVRPFPRFDSGYNKGVYGFYFSAADNLTTDQPYIIRISQNPAFFDSPLAYDTEMPLSAWTSANTQALNQLELTLNILSLAEDMEAAHDATLLESSVGGTVLSDPTGETYFRGAIYGIQAMAPSLFLVQSLTWDTDDRDWETTEFDDYGTRFSGYFIGTAADNTSATFGLETPMFMGLIFALPVIVGAVVVSSIKFKKAEPGFLVSSLVLILVALMGWIDIALFALVFQMMAMYIGYLWFYSRTGDSFGSKMFSFMAFVWIMSTMICLVIEGSWFGGPERTVINDLSAITSINIGGLVPIPAPSLFFFRGVFRMLLWDYSFYTGMFEMVRWIWLVVFTGGAVWGVMEKFAPVFANFLRIR